MQLIFIAVVLLGTIVTESTARRLLMFQSCADVNWTECQAGSPPMYCQEGNAQLTCNCVDFGDNIEDYTMWDCE